MRWLRNAEPPGKQRVLSVVRTEEIKVVAAVLSEEVLGDSAPAAAGLTLRVFSAAGRRLMREAR